MEEQAEPFDEAGQDIAAEYADPAVQTGAEDANDWLVVYEGNVMHPDSPIDLMRRKLKELGEPEWGTKDRLWTKLKAAESHGQKRKAEFAAHKKREYELTEHAGEASAEGGETTTRAPPPTLRELVRECQRGRRKEDTHSRAHPGSVQVCGSEIALDFGYNGDNKDELSKHDIPNAEKNNWTKVTLFGVDAKDWLPYGDLVTYTSVWRPGVLGEVSHDQVDESGASAVGGGTEGEGAQAEHRVAADAELLPPTQSKSGDTLKQVRSMAVTMRYVWESKNGTSLRSNSDLCLRLMRHAAWTLSRYAIRPTGRSNYAALHDLAYRGGILPFGETVVNKVAHGRPQRAKGACLGRGLRVCRAEKRNEHLVITSGGLERCKTVRRTTEGNARGKGKADLPRTRPEEQDEPTSSLMRRPTIAEPTPSPTTAISSSVLYPPRFKRVRHIELVDDNPPETGNNWTTMAWRDYHNGDEFDDDLVNDNNWDKVEECMDLMLDRLEKRSESFEVVGIHTKWAKVKKYNAKGERNLR